MIFFIFILWSLLAEVIINGIRFLVRKKTIKTWAHVLILIAEFVVALVMAFLPMGGPIFLRPVQPFLMALYVALFMDSMAKILYLIILAITKKEHKWFQITIISIVAGCLFFTYGVVNMQIVTPKYHTYKSDKLTNEYKIAFVADLHVGSAQSWKVTEKTIKAINDEHPDFTILGGDIVDDYTSKEDMQKTFELFGNYDNPVYFIFGNHEKLGHEKYTGHVYFTEEELVQTILDNGIIILRDEFVSIAPDLVLLGREDISAGDGRAKSETLVNPNPEAYLLCADHQPVKFKENASIGVDLQLSGHTHAGQLFPLGLMYMVIGPNYGDYRKGNSIMNVSSGACGWRMPIRTQNYCHYEVVTLSPA